MRLPHFVAFLLLIVAPSYTAAQSANSLQKGIDAYESAQYDRAETILAAVQKNDPQNADAAYYLGRTLMNQDRPDKAIEHFEKATSLDNTKAEYEYWLSNAVFIQINEVGALKKMRYAKKGKAAIDRCLELDQDFAECHLANSNYYYQAPRIAGGDKDKAWHHAKRYHELKPIEGTSHLVERHIREEQPEKAEALIASLLATYPDNIEALKRAGWYYRWQKKYDAAFDVFEKSVTIDKEAASMSFYDIAKTAIAAESRLDRGIEALEIYMTLPMRPYQPSHASALWRMGMLHELKGSAAEAKSAYQKALSLDPEHEQAKKALKALG
ncbi:MAG: tetratricopeptide repeat protein [Bacteroidota bacterium]